MAEVLTIIGVVASCDQLLKRLNTLHRNLRKAYRCIRFARNDIELIKNRTWIIIKLWRFFRKCLNKVSKVEGFSPDFERYMKINQSLERQAQEVNHKIGIILKDLDPLWTSEPVPAWREWYAKVTWLMRNQEETRLLFADMDLLIQYMQVYILLVQLQISVQQYRLSSSAATGLQVEMLGEMIDTGLRGLRQIHNQYMSRSNERSVVSNKDSRFLLREIRAIVREEMSQIAMRDMGNDLNSVPRPRSPQIFTAPSNLHTILPASSVPRDEILTTGKTNSAEFFSESHVDADHSHYSNDLSRNNSSNRHYSIAFCPSSNVSYVSNQEITNPIEPADNEDPTRAEETVSMEEIARKREEDEDFRESPIRRGKIYVPTALFGSPEKRHRQA